MSEYFPVSPSGQLVIEGCSAGGWPPVRLLMLKELSTVKEVAIFLREESEG